MASDDVIELDSTDDELESTPKKAKPVPNAMVHIPELLSGVQSKLLAGRGSKALFGKVASSSSFIRNIVKNPYAVKKCQDIKITNSLPPQGAHLLRKPIVINTSIVKGKPNSETHTKRLPTDVIKKVQRLQGQKYLSSLPPGITVTRMTGQTQRKRKAEETMTASTMIKKQKVAPPKIKIANVFTMELDDDEAPKPTTPSPLWYLRPDDENTNLEEKNNKEPDKSKFIEITIEDSPIKSINDKKACEDELPIIIYDSPVKPISEKKNVEKHKNPSENYKHNKIKTPNSKKKLQYNMIDNSIEIEIDKNINEIGEHDTEKNDKTAPKEYIEIEISLPVDYAMGGTNSELNKVVSDNNMPLTVIELDSPIKKCNNQDEQCASTSEHQQVEQCAVDRKSNDNIENQCAVDSSEFHPVYQDFIDLCFKLENSDDMKKIVEKKIKSYYKQVPTDYTESESFIEMVTSKIIAIQASPDKMYLYIKDIVDELNMQRKIVKSQSSTTIKLTSQDDTNTDVNEDTPSDSKQQRRIRKLEKTLKKLHRAIQRLEEQEVDFDDEADSVYLLTERYKERLIRVHAKLCQLTNTKMPSEPRVSVEARSGQPAGPAKRLEKWINRKLPIGTPLPFPDFHDVLRCVRDANDEDSLGWNEADVMEEARDLFVRCGKKLKRRRQENEWRIASSRISAEIDPAENSEDLKRKLEENNKMSTQKETDVINKYADRQKQLKLEAVEICDKEADESPVDSDDETCDGKKNECEIVELKNLKDDSKVEGEAVKNIENIQQNGSNLDNMEVDIDVKKLDQEITKQKTDMNNVPESKDLDITEEVGNLKDIASDVLSVKLTNDDINGKSYGDELNLLETLDTENQISTLESSDSDTPIAISDTLEAISESNVNSNDVVSIENSSYSENEDEHRNDYNNKNNTDDLLEISEDLNLQIEHKDESDECTESIQEVLLASTDDDEGDENKNSGCILETTSVSQKPNFVNSKDDSLFIGETTVEGEEEEFHRIENSVEPVVNIDSVNENKNCDILNTSKSTPVDNLTLSSSDNDAKVDKSKNCESSEVTTVKHFHSENDVECEKTNDSENDSQQTVNKPSNNIENINKDADASTRNTNSFSTNKVSDIIDTIEIGTLDNNNSKLKDNVDEDASNV